MKDTTDIKELGLRIKSRDEEAFRILYAEAFSNLQHYAMRYLYDWDEAENLVQESFFSLWCNLDKYDGKRNIVTYLLVIVKNNCLNYIRDLKIRDQHQDKMIEALLFSNLREEASPYRPGAGYCRIDGQNLLQTGNGLIAGKFTVYHSRILIIEKSYPKQDSFFTFRRI